jgi:hypothetical protein
MNADEATRTTDGEETDEPYRFVMPEWMEPYRGLISNTGGNSIEDLIDDMHNNRRLLAANVVRWSLAMGVYGQVNLLYALYEGGHLTPLA